ncbi:hypothetical protein AVEN_168229-1 [Araneus ventricosus]|uniref:Mariner Mos1 transposase n=1 Tax=Araneus ventricosus TaxID=182803 RepID=A0A4Y2UYA2_ARAVE|nr:hypothetical protein AVEN_168229-1 [Araneus ventricosus]
MDNVKRAFDEKRPELTNRKGVVCHQDNAKLHLSLATRRKLYGLSWDIVLHLPYCPDLAPSDFYMFRNLQNTLMGKKFSYLEDWKKHLQHFLSMCH